jgi:hypothetical protein
VTLESLLKLLQFLYFTKISYFQRLLGQNYPSIKIRNSVVTKLDKGCFVIFLFNASTLLLFKTDKMIRQ